MVDVNTKPEIARVVRENGHIVIVMPDSFEIAADELMVAHDAQKGTYTFTPSFSPNAHSLKPLWNYIDSLGLTDEQWDEFAEDMYSALADREISESRDIFGDDEE